MTSLKRVVQVGYLAVLAALALPPAISAQKVVPCNVCVNQCENAPNACAEICEAGQTISLQCWSSQACTSISGHIYAATVTCTVLVP